MGADQRAAGVVELLGEVQRAGERGLVVGAGEDDTIPRKGEDHGRTGQLTSRQPGGL